MPTDLFLSYVFLSGVVYYRCYSVTKDSYNNVLYYLYYIIINQ